VVRIDDSGDSIMNRAEEHGWYGRSVEPWTEKQLADYYCLHGFVVQQSDVVDGGVPTRSQLNAMRAMPGKTDVPRYWVGELSRARDMLDEAEQLPDGSAALIILMENAADIEEEAVRRLNERR
jgi:hypothetical protein